LDYKTRRLVQRTFQRGIAAKLRNENLRLKREQNSYRKVLGQEVDKESGDARWRGLEKAWTGYWAARDNIKNRNGRGNLDKEIQREKEYAALVQKYARLLGRPIPEFEGLDLEDDIEFENIKKKLYEDRD